MPIKLTYRMTFAVLGAVGLTGGVSQTTSIGNAGNSGYNTIALSASDTPSVVMDGTPTNDAAWTAESPDSTAERILQNINDKAGEGGKVKGNEDKKGKGTNVDDISPEERQRQESMPRNPKKRMWEEKMEDAKKDEL